MPLIDFIKKNTVLVIGLTLPILLIALFFVASVLPKSMATPPQYEMLFSVSRYDSQNSSPYKVNFVVKAGVLNARIIKKDSKNFDFSTSKLMAYDGKTDSVHEIVFDISKLGDVTESAEIILDETKNMRIDTTGKAPDGYVFEGSSRGSGGLATELFWGYRGAVYRVKKGAVGYKIPHNLGNRYYSDVQFIGWVIEKK